MKFSWGGQIMTGENNEVFDTQAKVTVLVGWVNCDGKNYKVLDG